MNNRWMKKNFAFQVFVVTGVVPLWIRNLPEDVLTVFEHQIDLLMPAGKSSKTGSITSR